jgi:beta-N-acetylhexosaminidase
MDHSTPTQAQSIQGTGSNAMRHEDRWRALTLRQKIGQVMLMLPDRQIELELGNGSLEAFFERYPVSGFFMGWKLYDGVAYDARFDHIRRSVREYQAASRLPLVFQEDYESGIDIGGMTPFPGEMAVGAAASPELA